MAKKINVTLEQFKKGIALHAATLKKHGILDPVELRRSSFRSSKVSRLGGYLRIESYMAEDLMDDSVSMSERMERRAKFGAGFPKKKK